MRPLWMSTIVLILLAGAGVGGYFYYREWNQERLMRRARALYEWKETGSAVLTLQRILHTNRDNIAATRMIAEIAGKSSSREALGWSRRVVELEPDVLENHLAAVRIAIEIGEFDAAGEILRNVGAKLRDDPAYHAAAGKLAVKQGDVALAEKELAKAVAAAPDSDRYRLELAFVRLKSESAEDREVARETLRALAGQPEFLREATRALIDDALAGGNGGDALTYASALRAASDSTFEDRLFHLHLLRSLGSNGFAGALIDLQAESIRDPAKTAHLIQWMTGNSLSMFAIEWSGRFPKGFAYQMPVVAPLAEAHLRIGDMKGLKALLAPDSEKLQSLGIRLDQEDYRWEGLEHFRLAMLARVLRKEGNLRESDLKWNAAVVQATGFPGAMKALAMFALEWGWKTEAVPLLWAIERSTGERRWALETLRDLYTKEESTRNLSKVAYLIAKLEPADSAARHQAALLGLLSDSQVKDAAAIAASLHQEEPANPDFAATHAFALHLTGKDEEALKVLRDQPETHPRIALYLGVVLAAMGETGEAARHLITAEKGSLSKDEAALLRDTRNAPATVMAGSIPVPEIEK